jgi:4-amino-4-deoxy-L-arabinose transferase-like glycosyltransferase
MNKMVKTSSLQLNHLNPHQINSSRATILFIAVLTVGRAFLQKGLYQQGFVSVSADEFARSLRALAWSKHLQINLPVDLMSSPWPPFEMYLNGFAIRILGDAFIAPRITVFIASCLLLISFFLLVQQLWDNWLVAALATLIVATQPWFIWLSATPMLEMYFLACFIGGLYFLMFWLQKRDGLGWLFAGLLFFLASGFHVQSWAQINIINLLTLLIGFRFIKERQYIHLGQLALFWLIGNGFILFWGLAEYKTTGQLFGILANHSEYSRWFYDGYDVSVGEKLFYFPSIVGRVIPVWLWLSSGIGLSFVIVERRNYWRLLPLVIGLFTLTLASIFNLTAGPPSAAPDRYALFYLLLIVPYAAYGFTQLLTIGWRWTEQLHKRRLAYGWTVILGSLLTVMLLQGIAAAQHFPSGMARDTLETGRYLHEILNNPALSTPPLQAGEMVMLEARYWDFLALELMTEQNEKLLYDREHDYLHRDNPSRLLEDADAVQSWLMEMQVGLVVLKDPTLKKRADELVFLTRQKEVGDWTVFRLVTKQ